MKGVGFMNADLSKRLFKAIYSEDIPALKKIASLIVKDERTLGHCNIADALEKIANTEKPRFTIYDSHFESGMSSLPKSKRTNSQLLSYTAREQLKHQIVLEPAVEKRILSIEQEFAARERLKAFNLIPKRKISLYGPPGCGKTLSVERIA